MLTDWPAIHHAKVLGSRLRDMILVLPCTCLVHTYRACTEHMEKALAHRTLEHVQSTWRKHLHIERVLLRLYAMKSITAVIGLRDSHVSYGKRSRTYEQSDLWDSRVSICYDFFLATSNCTCTSDLHHVSHESVIAQLGLALAWSWGGRAVRRTYNVQPSLST